VGSFCHTRYCGVAYGSGGMRELEKSALNAILRVVLLDVWPEHFSVRMCPYLEIKSYQTKKRRGRNIHSCTT
jgi:hypothetical protein